MHAPRENRTSEENESLTVTDRSKAGHYEILGETYAKLEFFENGWNPYSRFLDVDKVDLILRRKNTSGKTLYREVQVKFGKLYEVGGARWERELFDCSSWRFFKKDEFAGQLDQKDFFVAYILVRDTGYKGDIFIFPIRDFVEKIIRCAISSKSRKHGSLQKVYISHLRESEQWFLRRMSRFTAVTDETCLDVSEYRRNFSVLKREIA